MIAPEPAPAATVPGTQRSGAAAALAGGALAGAALAAAAIAAGALQRDVLPFGASGRAGWLGCGALAGLGAVFGAGRHGAALAVGAAAVAAASQCGPAPLPGVALGALAVALGAVLAGARACRLDGACALAAGLVAAVGFVAASAAPPFAAEPALVVAVALALAAGLVRGAASAADFESPPVAPYVRLARGVLAGGALALLATALGRDPATSPFATAAVAVALAGIAALAAARLPAAFVAGVAAAGLATFAAPRAAAWHGVELARRGDVAAHYVRASQELRLLDGGQLVDAAGPDRLEAPLAAVVAHALTQPGDRVLVLGLGTGRALDHLARAGERVLDAVDWRPDADAVRPHLRGDGPVPATAGAGASAIASAEAGAGANVPPRRAAAGELAPAATTLPERGAAAGAAAIGAAPPVPVRARVAGVLPALAALADGARQAIVVAEPLGPASATPSDALQRELARVAGGGPVVQVIALDRTPPAALAALFAAAARAQAWHGLFVVGDAAVLVGAARPPAWAALPPLANWSTAARWLAHEAHLGSVADLQRAFLGSLRPAHAVADAAAALAAPAAHAAAAATVVDPAAGPAPGRAVVDPGAAPAPGRAAALAVVKAWVQPALEVTDGAPSLLLRWTSLQAELRAAVARLRALPDDAAARAEAQALAARFLHLGAPRSELQAALGLPTLDGVTLLAPALASRRAHALDPTFFAQPPAVAAGLPVPRDPIGALEDFAALPPPARLAELAGADTPLATALRARFPSRCAAALVAALARGPLDDAARQALRELADVFVLTEAAAVLPRPRARELLALWRVDLPMPPALAALARHDGDGNADERRALASALRGRRDPSSYGALADLLEAPERDVRRLAGDALQGIRGARSVRRRRSAIRATRSGGTSALPA